LQAETKIWGDGRLSVDATGSPQINEVLKTVKAHDVLAGGKCIVCLFSVA